MSLSGCLPSLVRRDHSMMSNNNHQWIHDLFKNINHFWCFSMNRHFVNMFNVMCEVSVIMKWKVNIIWALLFAQIIRSDCGFLKPQNTRRGFTMCGTRLVRPPPSFYSPRIVGGRDALPGELPFQVALYRSMPRPVYYAGGSLITDRHILTCGHCIAGINSSDVTVWIGIHRKDLPALITRGRTQRGGMFFVHPAFDRVTLSNDIGIIRLRKRVVLDGFVNTLCLPSPGLPIPDNVFVAGYGFLDAGGPLSEMLQVVQMDVIDSKRCVELLPDFGVNPNTTLCTLTDDRDACTGDSGGPMFQTIKGRLVQLGIVSWGRSCALKDSPGVYTNVAAYLNWILGIIDLG